ncbi:hypothetical protein JCM8115_000892 [Rhodotorula mucilaginosa]|jgi:hypothetical protein|uniref:AB hydrolase-1 domain-containing protein n=1 Tax=Rhodotorula mucilaginosa TaxID=5537 RepID=A0A9P7B332_RHOMI|nr:hypothetical protein C6P46_006915 [Rhodotorula mucilaginosa]TKA57057.1 hypothetical protein B0A53_01013 [Rhodotorula sp. CCFEE 5036]
MDDPLPAAYLDAEKFLHDPAFHRTTTYGGGDSGPLTVSYAVAGSRDLNAPVVVWINGMGGHRLAACLLDGKFAASGVRLITIDRPSAGKSTAVPLADRVHLSHEALLAVLAAENNITRFSILSHSNGVIYTLYTLLHLPPHLSVPSWTLSSPWVPPFLSGSTLLSIASWIPTPLTSRLGGFVSGLQRVLGPLDAGLGWSTGVVRGMTEWSSGFVSMGTHVPAGAASTTTTTTAGARNENSGGGGGGGEGEEPELLTPEKQRERFRRNNAKRPYHKQLFGGEYVPPGLFNAGMKIALDEGVDAMGQEAMLCLRQGDGARWGWVEDDGNGSEEPRADEMQLYARGFGRLRDGVESRGRPLRMSVWYGAEDGLIPRRGREYLQRLLCSELGMVPDAEWHEVKDAGHDDTLGLTCVIEPFLEQVVEAHRDT